jgi:acyl-CoA thioesterase II
LTSTKVTESQQRSEVSISMNEVVNMAEVATAWQKYPGYRIEILPFLGTGRACIGEFVVAESRECVLVRESDHVDQLYFPLADVTDSALVESDHHTICGFKGEATHYDLSAGGVLLNNAMWCYPNPMSEVAELAGYAGFYTDRVDVSASTPFGDGDEARVQFPIWGTSDDLVNLMDVTPLGDGTFVAPPHPDPPIGTFFSMEWHDQRRVVVEGGQLLGAAIVAAAKSRPDQRVTSIHMTFVKAASFDEPIQMSVHPHHKGSSLSAFDLRVEQAGRLRAAALIMTDVGADDFLRHDAPMPDVPSPAECPRYDFGVLGREIRIVEGRYSLDDGPSGPPELYLWTRFTKAPTSEALHQALLAQPTTHYSIGAALRAHQGVSEDQAHRTVSMGPVSATVAFHGAFDVTDWLLTETRSIWAGRGSSQSQIRVFTADGRLVASKTVQAIIRPFKRTPEQLGRDYSTAM